MSGSSAYILGRTNPLFMQERLMFLQRLSMCCKKFPKGELVSLHMKNIFVPPMDGMSVSSNVGREGASQLGAIFH